jgi:hypothetical protein
VDSLTDWKLRQIGPPQENNPYERVGKMNIDELRRERLQAAQLREDLKRQLNHVREYEGILAMELDKRGLSEWPE